MQLPGAVDSSLLADLISRSIRTDLADFLATNRKGAEPTAVRSSPSQKYWRIATNVGSHLAMAAMAAMALLVVYLTRDPGFVAAGGAAVPGILPPQLVVTPLVTGRRLALVIGVSKAPGRKPLFAAEDAQRFCDQVLVGQLRFARGDIRLLTDMEPTKAENYLSVDRYGQPTVDEVKDGLAWLRETARPGDLIVIFIACHGEIDSARGGKQLSFILSDGNPFPAAPMLQEFVGLENVVKLGVVDSCFSGNGVAAIGDGLPASGDTGGPAVILSSSSPDQNSWTDTSHNTGAFQAALREAFAAADSADQDDDNCLSPNELFQRITDSSNRLLKRAPAVQVPQIWASQDAYIDLPLFSVRPLNFDDRFSDFAKYPLLGPVTHNTPVPDVMRLPRAKAAPAETSDEVGERYYVYRDGESGAEFRPTGFVPDGASIAVNTSSMDRPHSGTMSLRADIQLSSKSFAGVFFLLDGEMRPNRTFNLLERLSAEEGDAIKCRFWACSDSGTRVKFKVGGVAQGDVKDSLMFGGNTGLIRLSPEFERYEIDLTGKDLSSVVGAFSWICSRADNGDRDLTFYLDDIYFVKVRSKP